MKFLFSVLVLILFLVAGCASQYPKEQVDAFAKCLTEKDVKMYGTFWCPKCAEQKKMFSTSFQYINYVECDPRGDDEQSELCIEKEVLKYPDWEFADGERKVGILPFETLSEKTGCLAPQHA